MRRLTVFLCFIFLGVSTYCDAWAALVPISEIKIERSGFLYNRQTDTFDTAVTLRNLGTTDLGAPLRLIVDAVKPVSVSLYNKYGEMPDGRPYIDVPLDSFMLKAGGSIKVPVRFVNLGKAVTAATFSVQAERLSSDNTASINLTVKFDSENGGNSVGPGFLVKVNGVARAITDANGGATIRTPVDSTEITASSPPNYIGSLDVNNLMAGESRNVSIEVGDSGEFGGESQLRIDRLQHLMLPLNIPQVAVRLFSNEKTVLADLLTLAELRDPSGGQSKDITNLFVIKNDGSIVAKSPEFFSAVGQLGGKKLLFIQVLDKQGINYQQEVPFYISQISAQAKISAPPSNPSIPLGGIPIQVAILNTDIKFLTETTSDGSFPLPKLPTGSVSLRGQINAADGLIYIGDGVAVLSGNRRIDLKMRGPADIVNNVPPITTSPL